VKEEAKAEAMEEMSHMMDPRIRYFNVENSASSIKSDRQSMGSMAVNAEKDEVRKFGRCMGCGVVPASHAPFQLTCAHILSSREHQTTINSHFGIDGEFVDNPVLWSQSNYLLLCGTKGQLGSCHDKFDTRKMSLFYSYEDGFYKWYSLDNLEQCFNAGGFIDSQVITSLSRTVNGSFSFHADSVPFPIYLRFLAWRTINCLSAAGNSDFGKNRAGFIEYLKRSEESECTD
jgi:hypothetical protein